MQNNIIFIGEDNRINNELYQLLNWRYKVTYYPYIENAFFYKLSESNPELILVSMTGKQINYSNLFKYLAKEYPKLPVITVLRRDEMDIYEEFYTTEQFHKILRPVTGKKILEICNAVITGTAYSTDDEKAANPDESTSVQDDRPHVLVVDDNAIVLRNIKGILDTRYSVAVAASGLQAMTSIALKLPDLILLDYAMPNMNGKQVMESLRSNEKYKDIPIIFLTGVDFKELVIEILSLKPAGYILKPVDSELLLNRIEQIIGR